MHHLYDDTYVSHNDVTTTLPPEDRTLNPVLLDRLSTDQRTAFLNERDLLPPYVRAIAFDLDGRG